jgi:capsular exopolysaccharide synthesis family protein
LAEKLDEATDRFNQIKAQVGTKHPEYQKAASEVATLQEALERVRGSVLRRIQSEYNEAQSREQVLAGAVNQAKIEADLLNQNSFGYQNVKQEAETDKKLYEELVRKIKEASINSGFQNNAIRLADPARPVALAIFPNVGQNTLLAVVLSLLLACAVSLLHDVSDTSVRDPDLVRNLLRTDVVGSLPLVKGWKGRRLLSAGIDTSDQALLSGALVKFGEATERPIAIYDEAVRTLRNSVLLADVGNPINSLMFTSAMPAEGKTTTSVHFAVAHAQQGNRTLLIDADLRRPGTHRALGLKTERGLSDILLRGEDWRSFVQTLPDIPNLYVLPAGNPSRTAADMVGKGMPELLAQATGDYDFIVIDAPPLLGFSEPLRLAVLVDGVIVVALAGQTDRKAVSAALETLRRLKARVLGMVLNEITRELSSSYSYYGYYGKYYSYYHSGKPRN